MSIKDAFRRVKTLVIGKAKDPSDTTIFHKLSLIAFFAWVGLGSDGLSSSCYGPEEAFRALQAHPHLSILIAIAAAFTIFVISTSYSQIIELFPSGGGGYVVATKLLSPKLGMVSGCALLIDYVLTITISVASGVDAVFSFLPHGFQHAKVAVGIAGILVLIILNMRGVKESVVALLPIFMVFVVTHAVGLVYAVATHAGHVGELARGTASDFQSTFSQVGLFGVAVLLLRAYSTGAGTYTGIEAVSNGVSILREPKVKTAKKTMVYMATSLAFVVFGLMLGYLLYKVEPVPGKTLNAVLFASIFGAGKTGYVLLLLTLISEAAILFVAAQTGFVDGPRVIANMASDKWFPTRFTMLSDRLVTENGVLLMGGAALAVLALTGGSVDFLVVLYSINVFITFVLSQLGMVRHWWDVRREERAWKKKIAINGVGLLLTSVILVSVVVIKFHEGGWITLLITGALIALVTWIKRHYTRTGFVLRRLDALVSAVGNDTKSAPAGPVKFDPRGKTAVLMVNGFNGLGLHTLLGVFRYFKSTFKNFIIIQVGIVDTGAFKGSAEMEKLEAKIKSDLDKYVDYVKRQGYYAEGIPLIGVDVVDEIMQAAPSIVKRFQDSVFFGGQLVFPEEPLFSRWLHNYTVFALQRRFYYMGVPVVLLPIRL